MGGFAFLMMLGSYGVVLYWYALNHERDEDGRDGILGIQSFDQLETPKKPIVPGRAFLRLRGKTPKHGRSTAIVNTVRAKAARSHQASGALSKVAQKDNRLDT